MGSSKPSLKSNDKEGFLRALTDEWVDLEKDQGVVLEMGIRPAGRKGLISVSLTAYKANEGHTGIAQAHYACEYPTAQLEGLEACLFRCAVRLGRVLADRRAFPMGKA